MFLSDMERKTLAITPPFLLSILFFHLRGAFGSSKTFHYLLLLSCLLLSSVNTLHNLAEYDDSSASHAYNSAACFHHFNGGHSSVTSVPQRSVCISTEFSCFISSQNQSDSVVPFGFPGFNKSWSNNVSDVKWLSSLKGHGKSMSLLLYDDSKLVHFIEFQPLPSPIQKSPPFTGIRYIGDSNCYKPLLQELYGKTTGELSGSVSCGENCFLVQKLCEGLGLEPGESMEFLVLYQSKPLSSVMFRDFGLSSTSGVLLAVPMKSTLPVLMLNLCKKTVFWVRTKKLSMAILLLAAAALLLMFCLVSPQMTVIISHDDFIEIKKRNYNHVEIKSVDKSSQENCNITISPEMDSLLRSISEETLQVFNNNKDNNSSRTSITRTPITSVSSSQEESNAVNLTVKTAKDKKKRRKKKKKGAVNGVITPERSIEASSSHSGDSTPTSPLSPLISLPSEQPTRQPPPLQEAKKPANSPRSVLSHSATFPGPEVKSQRSERSSSLAPNVRAPGAKVSEKSRKEVKEEQIKEYKYDIWGDHLTGLNLMDRFKDVRAGKSSGFGEDECESFFVKGSPSFLQDSHARFVSFYNQWG